MKGRLSLLCLPLLLAACHGNDVLLPQEYDLSGTLHGDWGSNPHLRLALVGTGFPNPYANNSTTAQTRLDPYVGGMAFGIDLPAMPNLVGVYQVIAFDDTNNNARYDIGEPVARNRQWLLYSPADTTTPAVNIPSDFPWAAGEEAIPSMTVKRGWNVYNRAQQLSSSNPYQVAKITGYDIYR